MFSRRIIPTAKKLMQEPSIRIDFPHGLLHTMPSEKCYSARMPLKSATYKKPKMEASLVRRLECDNVTLR